jgi:hypothetical protein
MEIPKFNFLQFKDLVLILNDKSQQLLVIYEDEPVLPQELSDEEYTNIMQKFVIDLRAIQFEDSGKIGIGVTLVDEVQTIIMPDFGSHEESME